MERGQNINIYKSVEEVDFQSYGRLWSVQVFYQGNNFRWGGNNKKQ